MIKNKSSAYFYLECLMSKYIIEVDIVKSIYQELFSHQSHSSPCVFETQLEALHFM